jgi:uncharacterized RDD family membrane protein YckC
MHFRVIEGEASGLAYFRAVRILSIVTALMILSPALLLISFAIFVLISFADASVSSALREMSVGERLGGIAIMGALAVPLLLLGRRFILGRRRLVLFLRRFGAVGGLEIVTAAAMGGLGFGFRLVTLDDRSTPTGAGPRAQTVADERDFESALAGVRRMSRRLLGPTRLFLAVADPIWQAVVLRLAEEADAVLIDVSEPGTNLLWEIETIGPSIRPRWILVGEATALHRHAVVPLAAVIGEPRTDQQRLAGLLRGEDVVAYRIGQGVTSFRQALRARYARATRLRVGSGQAWAGEPTPSRVEDAGSEGTGGAMPPASTSPGVRPARWWPGRDLGLPASGAGSLASIAERVGARAIDGGIWFGATLAVIEAEGLVRHFNGRVAAAEPDAISSTVGLVLFVLLAGYDPLTSRLLGVTPGKRALGLRVVTENGIQPASPVLVGLRGVTLVVLWLACFVPGMLDVAAAVADPSRRAWHDRLAGTLVVRAERRGPRRPHRITRRSPPAG